MFDRPDLAAKTRMFDRLGDAVAPPAGAIVLAASGDPVTNAMVADGLIVRVASIADVAGGPEQFTIFRAVGSAPR
jgi:hypothetical protein